MGFDAEEEIRVLKARKDERGLWQNWNQMGQWKLNGSVVNEQLVRIRKDEEEQQKKGPVHRVLESGHEGYAKSENIKIKQPVCSQYAYQPPPPIARFRTIIKAPFTMC